MTVSTDATEPGSVASTSTSVAPAVSVLQATQVPTSVQDAIDANVAAYRASLESQIKTTVAPATPTLTPASVPGLLSRAASVTGAAVSDVKSGVGDVVSGAELAGGDFLAVIKGKPAQIQNQRWRRAIDPALAYVRRLCTGDRWRGRCDRHGASRTPRSLMAGAPEPVAPSASLVSAQPPPIPPDADQVSVAVRTDDGSGNTTETVAVSSSRSWLGALFAAGDMSVDSLIVIMAVSVLAFWLIVGFQVIVGHETSSPVALGSGFAAMLAAFGGRRLCAAVSDRRQGLRCQFRLGAKSRSFWPCLAS